MDLLSRHNLNYATEFAESEFEKYRITQDQLFESDFDKLVKSANPAIEHKPEKTVTKKKVLRANTN